MEVRLVAVSFSRHQDEKSTDDMPFRHADCGHHRCFILWGKAPPTNSDHGIMVAKSGDLYTPVVPTLNPRPGGSNLVILTTVQSPEEFSSSSLDRKQTPPEY